MLAHDNRDTCFDKPQLIPSKRSNYRLQRRYTTQHNQDNTLTVNSHCFPNGPFAINLLQPTATFHVTVNRFVLASLDRFYLKCQVTNYYPTTKK